MMAGDEVQHQVPRLALKISGSLSKHQGQKFVTETLRQPNSFVLTNQIATTLCDGLRRIPRSHKVPAEQPSLIADVDLTGVVELCCGLQWLNKGLMQPSRDSLNCGIH